MRRSLVRSPAPHLAVLLAAFGLLTLLCLPTPVQAQVGASVSVVSDYRYRGRTISDRRPTASVNLSYDHSSGLYAGGSLIVVDTAATGARLLGYVDYVGYVTQPRDGPAFDVGLTNSHISYYKFGERTVHYNEVYAGVLTDHASLRLYYSPSYFGQRVKTIYANLSGVYRPAPDWRLFGHLGALTPVGGRKFPGSHRERYDMSVGVAAKVKDAELSLSVSRTVPNLKFSNGHKLERDAVVAGITYFF
jgi:uncharacterized protein (TIGR02001 family)